MQLGQRDYAGAFQEMDEMWREIFATGKIISSQLRAANLS